MLLLAFCLIPIYLPLLLRFAIVGVYNVMLFDRILKLFLSFTGGMRLWWPYGLFTCHLLVSIIINVFDGYFCVLSMTDLVSFLGFHWWWKWICSRWTEIISHY